MSTLEPQFKDVKGIDPREIKFARRESCGQSAFWNARREFHEVKLAETKESIRKTGLITNPTVRALNSNSNTVFELVCGERRLRCILQLIEEGALCWCKRRNDFLPAIEVYSTLFCNVEYDCDDRRAAELSMAENLAREDVSELDLMVYCRDLCELKTSDNEPLYTRKDVKEIINRSEGWICQTLSLWGLPERAKEMLAKQILPRTTALYLLKIPEEMINSVLDGAEKRHNMEVQQDMEEISSEISGLEEQLEIVQASESIVRKNGLNSSKVAKSKTMLEKKLEEAKTKKSKVGQARITPEKLQMAADSIPEARRGKAIGLSHKTIREMRNELIGVKEMKTSQNLSIEPFHIEIVVAMLNMVLAESEDRNPFAVLDRLYKTHM